MKGEREGRGGGDGRMDRVGVSGEVEKAILHCGSTASHSAEEVVVELYMSLDAVPKR